MFKQNFVNFLLFLLLYVFVRYSHAFSGGAGTGACISLTPNHQGNTPQITEAPVKIIFDSDSTIHRNQPINVTIEATPGTTFRGFIIQARRLDISDIQESVVGTFDVTDGARNLNCENFPTATATHTSNAEKTSITLTWRTPPIFPGNSDRILVSFHLSIVQTFTVFWTNIPSTVFFIENYEHVIHPPIPEPPIGQPPVHPPIPDPPIEEFPSPYVGCGSTKTCFGYPNNCINSQNCQMFGGTFVENERFVFELFGTPTESSAISYIAFALSDDNRMPRASVIECVHENNAIRSYTSFTHDHSGSPRINDQSIIKFQRGQFNDGRIHCFVERDTVSTVNQMTFNLNENHFLLLAKGYSLSPNSVDNHYDHRAYSDRAYSLTDGEIVRAAGARPLTMAHGSIMAIAWIGCSTMGIFIARFFKKSWSQRTICGSSAWFFWHIFFQILTWALTISAIIIIFVDVGEWRTTTHSLIGIIVMSLAVIQPVGGIFRPKPTSTKRPIFNFVHGTVGSLIQFLAFFAIYFTVRLPAADLVDWTVYIIIAFVVFYLIMHIVFGIIEVFATMKKDDRLKKNVVNDSEPYPLLKKTLLGFFFLSVLLFTVAIVLLITLPSPN